MASDNFHHEILDAAGKRFPLESFLLMRREGLTTAECLEALGYHETQLSFQVRAALSVDPDDEAAIRKLMG